MTWAKGKGRQPKYGPEHQAERKRRLAVVKPGDPCGYCRRPLGPDTRQWHLPHNAAGTGYLPGMWCAPCNRSEGAQRGARIANARRKLRREGVTRLRW